MNINNKEINNWWAVHFVPPFTLDILSGYVFDKQNQLAFQFSDMYDDEILLHTVIDKINNKSETKLGHNLSYDNEAGIIFDGDNEFIIIRGFGHISNDDGEEVAIKVQDNFAKYIIDKLS